MPTTYEIDVKYGFIDAITGADVPAHTVFTTDDAARFDNIIRLGLGTVRAIRHHKKGKKIIIHQKLLYKIGGIETANYNLARVFKDKNITFLFNNYDQAQLMRLAEYCDVEIDDNMRQYKCDVLILANYDSGEIVLDRIEAKKVYNQCHADWLNMKKLEIWRDFEWQPDKRVDKVLSVSDTTKHALKKTMGVDSELVPNILAPASELPMVFLVMSRATAEKGIDRVFKLHDEFMKAGKDFVIYLCSAHIEYKPEISDEVEKRPRIVPVQPSLFNMSLLKGADYLVQLSYNESYCYSVREALQHRVPCIVSDIPELKKVIKDGKNGYIIKDDFTNLDVDRIFNSKPVIKEAYKEEVPAIWQKVLEGKL